MPCPMLSHVNRGSGALIILASLILLASFSVAGEKIDQDPSEIESIRDLLHRYSFFIDDARGDDFEELFTEQAVFNVLTLSFNGRKTIRKELIGRPGRLRKHLPFPAVIEIQSPDQALAWSDFIMVKAVEPDDPRSFTVYQMGRYHDRLVKEKDGRWRFAERNVYLPGMANSREFLPPPAR